MHSNNQKLAGLILSGSGCHAAFLPPMRSIGDSTVAWDVRAQNVNWRNLGYVADPEVHRAG